MAPPDTMPLATETEVDGTVKSYSLYDNQWDVWLADNYNLTGIDVKVYLQVAIAF